MLAAPFLLKQVRYAVREASAFVGHSFDPEDKELVDLICECVSKLGIKCDSGKRPEPKGISEKVRERIKAAELFIGIFTRRRADEHGKFFTSAWTIDEKSFALSLGKKILLFVEEGVEEFGGLQGDFEYIPFDRDNLAPALVQAIDYVLSVTAVPMTCRMEGPNKMQFHFGGMDDPAKQLEELRKYVAANPGNFSARLALAKIMAETGDSAAALAEMRKMAAECPEVADAHHELGHELERSGDRALALLSFQKALDLNATAYKNLRCYGKCLHRHALELADAMVKRKSLEKARRLLERAGVIGGQAKQQQIQGDLFVVSEAIAEISPVEEESPDA